MTQASQLKLYKEINNKLSAAPKSTVSKSRNPILQQDLDIKPKSYEIKLINKSPEKNKGIGIGKFSSQSKKSLIFQEPEENYSTSRSCIKASHTQRSCLTDRKSERINPITQETIPIPNTKTRDFVNKSSNFQDLFNDPSNIVQGKARTGK